MKFWLWNLSFSILVVLAIIFGEKWAYNLLYFSLVSILFLSFLSSFLIFISLAQNTDAVKKQLMHNYRPRTTIKNMLSWGFNIFILVLLASNGQFCLASAYLIPTIMNWIFYNMQKEWAKEGEK